MRSFLAAAAAVLLPALAAANQPQYNNQRPPPAFPICPDFFSTTATTNTSNPTYGPMENSVHYTLTTRQVYYGRNTWMQLRFYSNLQSTPIRNLEYCFFVRNWVPANAPADQVPQFRSRAQYKPKIRGAQPTIYTKPVTSQYVNTSTYPNRVATCVTVPYLKPKGWQKVDMLLYAGACLTNSVYGGWVQYQNPYNASETCQAAEPRANPNKKNAVRLLESANVDYAKICRTP